MAEAEGAGGVAHGDAGRSQLLFGQAVAVSAAFGLGLDRVAMLVHGIPDLRQMFEGDQRLTRQFA